MGHSSLIGLQGYLGWAWGNIVFCSEVQFMITSSDQINQHHLEGITNVIYIQANGFALPTLSKIEEFVYLIIIKVTFMKFDIALKLQKVYKDTVHLENFYKCNV